MSGLEAIGIVASILQIADLGAKVSVKLCSFYRTVKDANQSMQSLSSDVSLTCSILQELGKALEQDEQTKLCSPRAFDTAQDVLAECKTVFEGIDSAMEKQSQENARNAFLRRARKIGVAFMGPNLDLLKSNLERLKSTILLMLHVIMYARQLRQKVETSPRDDQRDLITTLMIEKKANDAKFKLLTKSIEAVDLDKGFQVFAVEAPSTPDPDQELEKYYSLVCKLLNEIDMYQDSLEKGRHFRMRTGILNLHSAEATILKHTHGNQSVGSYEEAFGLLSSANAKLPKGDKRDTEDDKKDNTKPPSSTPSRQPYDSTIRRPAGRVDEGHGDDVYYTRCESRTECGDETLIYHPADRANGGVSYHLESDYRVKRLVEPAISSESYEYYPRPIIVREPSVPVSGLVERQVARPRPLDSPRGRQRARSPFRQRLMATAELGSAPLAGPYEDMKASMTQNDPSKNEANDAPVEHAEEDCNGTPDISLDSLLLQWTTLSRGEIS
ncbi:hypothetical protein N7470_005315 [Penicillium chermesinum]|nr:hypothetical protein N7470_005315 [Penicillium chermesinum]